jgi:antitoxin component YwqK of YwqJK toxin-antitoxin module
VAGQSLQAGAFKNGKQVGLWKRYYENGQLWDEGTYAGGKKVGEWKVRQSWCAQAKESIQGEELRRAGESLGSQPCVPTGHGGPREQVKKR